MRAFVRCSLFLLLAVMLQAGAHSVFAQSVSGVISGVVTDPSGAVVPNATVTIDNPVSQYSRTAKTDANGSFGFSNVPFNPYHLTINATGFASPFTKMGSFMRSTTALAGSM